MNAPIPAAVPARRFPRHHRIVASAIVVGLMVLVRCASGPAVHGGSGIEVCGARFPATATIVNWRQPDGYDAYQRSKRFTTEAQPDGKLRYSPLRGNLPAAIQIGRARVGKECCR